MIKCPECTGKGEIYVRIAGDVHIDKCAACEGWGSVEQSKPQKKSKIDRESFGKINIDSLLADEFGE